MWYGLAGFIGAFLAASFAVGIIFMARHKINFWVWALFGGAVGFAVGGFGYISPETIPHGDLWIIGTLDFMLVGVFASYYMVPIDETYSPDAVLLLLEKQINGLRLVGIGVAITAILSFGSVYYLLTNINATAPPGMMGNIYHLVRTQQQEKFDRARYQDSLAHALRVRNQKDSLFQIETKAMLIQALQNQKQGLKNQKEVKQEQRKTNAQLKRVPPIIINQPVPKASTTPLLNDYSDKVQPVPVAPFKKGRKG